MQHDSFRSSEKSTAVPLNVCLLASSVDFRLYKWLYYNRKVLWLKSYKSVILWSVSLKTVTYFVTPDTIFFFTFFQHFFDYINTPLVVIGHIWVAYCLKAGFKTFILVYFAYRNYKNC